MELVGKYRDRNFIAFLDAVVLRKEKFRNSPMGMKTAGSGVNFPWNPVHESETGRNAQCF